MSNKKLCVEYLDSLNDEDFKLEDMMTEDDWEELKNPTCFLDESKEAWLYLSDEERQALIEFQNSLLDPDEYDC